MSRCCFAFLFLPFLLFAKGCTVEKQGPHKGLDLRQSNIAVRQNLFPLLLSGLKELQAPGIESFETHAINLSSYGIMVRHMAYRPKFQTAQLGGYVAVWEHGNNEATSATSSSVKEALSLHVKDLQATPVDLLPDRRKQYWYSRPLTGLLDVCDEDDLMVIWNADTQSTVWCNRPTGDILY